MKAVETKKRSVRKTWLAAVMGFVVGVFGGAVYLMLGGDYFFDIPLWSRLAFYPGFFVGERAYYDGHFPVEASKVVGVLAVGLAYALMVVLFSLAWRAVKRKFHLRSAASSMTILLALVSATLLGAAPSAAKLPAKNPEKIRLVMLPFQNATGDTNWDDWQQTLPGLARSCLDSAQSVDVVGWKKIKPVLQHSFTNFGAPDAKQASQVAQALNANVVVWGRYLYRTNQWIVETLIFQANSPAGPAQIQVASPGWVGLPEQLAQKIAAQFGQPLADEDVQYWEKYLTGSAKTLGDLAHALSLEKQEAPAAAQEKMLRRVLAEDPRCGAAHMLLIQILGGTDRTSDLETAIREFARQCPDLCDAHLRLAWQLGQGNDREGAKRELLEALRVHRGCPQACLALTVFLGEMQQRWEDLRKILEQAHADRPDNSDNAILLASARAQSGDIEGADNLLAGISDLPDENETVDLALLGAALFTCEFDLVGRELTRLGPQAAENETIRDTLNSVTLKPGKGINNSSNAPIARPRVFTEMELNRELERLLSAAESQLVVNPLEITPAIAAEARRLTVGLTNDAIRSLALFAEVARRGRGAGDGGMGTADQALEKSNDPQARFSCQEYAKLLVALARTLGLEAWLVHVDRDAHGNPCYHDCAVIFVNGLGILFDPTVRAIGVPHQVFTVLNDIQAISHQAMQLHGTPDPTRLRLGLKLNPDDRWTRLQFVRGMAHAGEDAAAAEELNLLRKTGVECWDVHEVAAELDMARKRWQPALAELQRALALSPSNTLVHFQLGSVYQDLGERATAVKHMEAALQFDRGELSQEFRRAAPGQIATMNTFIRSTAGDSSARADFQRQAEGGDAFAQLGMANACFEAKPPRTEEGMRWLLKAAEQGNEQAQYDYAKNLILLHGDTADKEAMAWLTRAAEQGYTEAQYHLGKFFYEGAHVLRDNLAAGQWIILASRSGSSEAKSLLKEMEVFLSTSEMTEARKRADGFKPAAASVVRKAK